MFKDYYKLLDITQNASEEEIKKAFREQAIKWHPDLIQNVPLKYIASYLGITDTSLSRIRKLTIKK